MLIENVIQKIAHEHDTTENEIRQSMTEAILAAKNNPCFQSLFGERMIPSPEAFIQTIVELMREPGGLSS